MLAHTTTTCLLPPLYLPLLFTFAMRLTIELSRTATVKSKTTSPRLPHKGLEPLSPMCDPCIPAKPHVFFLFSFLHLPHSKPKSPWPNSTHVKYFSKTTPRFSNVLFLNRVTKLFWGLDLRSQHLEDKVSLMGQGMLWRRQHNNNNQTYSIKKC